MSGAWEVGPSGEIVIQDGSMNFQGTFHNEGIIRFEANSHIVSTQGDVAINNLGTIVFGGSVNLGRLTEGTMTISNTGTLRIANADASVSLNSGQIIEQRGMLQISGGRLALQEPLIQTDGSIVLENGTLETPAGLTIQGGSMTGVGRVLGQLTNESVLRLGPAGGELQVDGDYIQTENGRLELLIATFAPAIHSFPLQISGLAQWNGVVQVDFANGFKGVAGIPLPLVAYANHAGIPSLEGNATMFGAVLKPMKNALNLVAPSPLTLNAMADGTVHLRFAGTPGKTMILEASTDLAAWTEIQRGNLGILEASDLDARDFPHRFYRIREQP